MNPTTPGPQPLTLTAADGYTLSATHYPATGPLRGRIVIAGATGVPQHFYRCFAVFCGGARPCHADAGLPRHRSVAPGQPARVSHGLLGPLLTLWKGYLPWSLLGMGEDLPLDVYRQWRAWCRHPRCFFDDPEIGAEVAASFDRIRTPIVAANALDDHWAPPASRDAFMAGYRNAGWRALDIDPATAGLGPIGHMGYFRPHSEPLWRGVLDWFEGLPAEGDRHAHAR